MEKAIKVFIFLIIFLATKCTASPVVKGTSNLKVIQEKSGRYKITIDIPIYNQHENLVLTSVKGRVNLIGKKQDTLLRGMEFTSSEILPLRTQYVFADAYLERFDFRSLVKEFEIDISEFNMKGEENISLGKENLSVEITSFDRTGIVDYLKEQDKQNEENL